MGNRQKFDLVIVGGGIVGAWALYLAAMRHRNLQTLLIERSTVGSGATSHSAGVFVAIGRTELERSLCTTSMALYAEVRSMLNIQAFECISYWISSRDTWAKAQASIMDVQPAAMPLSSAQISQALGHPVAAVDTEVIQIGGMPASFDPLQTARTIVQYCRQFRHVRCWEGLEAVSVVPGAGPADICLSDGSVVSADRLIVAVGPWMLGGLAKEAVNGHNVAIKRVVALHIDRTPTSTTPAIFFPDHDAYLMPLRARNQWLFSFHRKLWGCDPDTVSHEVGGDDLAEGAAVLDRYLPGLVDQCRGGRAFCDAYAASGEPVVAYHPCSRSVVVAGAGCGKGFRLAPGIADRALTLLC